MKLDVEVNEITLSNVITTGEFRIRNSAKAFKILSDGLYSNKIRAIIRELSCNAVDSHVAAGKADIPFEVHLPCMLEPWFAVKDFGTGLTGDQVTNIYTTYFESTKTDSNDFIGALGLGSKSPFSYTENFTVIAIKDGTKRIYSAFISEMGVPSIAEMSTELTDEGNGVEVKFSVTDRFDYNSFHHEAENVFMWFKNKPTITGVNFQHKTPTYKEKDIVPGVHVTGSTDRYEYPSKSTAVMGNIAYSLDKISEPEKHFGKLASLLECGLIIEFNIGELDFAASREELSIVPLTVNNIKKKLEAINANLASHLAKRADAIVDKWERAEYLYTEARTRLYASAVPKYVADSKFELYDPTVHYGKKIFNFTDAEMKSRGLSIDGMTFSHGCYRGKAGRYSTYIHTLKTYVEGTSIPVEKNVVIILNDLKTGCVSRTRYHYTNYGNDSVSVFCISHTDPDVAKRQVEYEAFLKELHNPPRVLKASELQKKPIVRREKLSSQGIMQIALRSDCKPGFEDSYTWVPYEHDLDDNDTYYYVCLNNFQPITHEGAHFDIYPLKALMDKCGVSDISDIRIMGVRKNRIDDIKDLPNWFWIETKLKEETTKITDFHIASMVAKEMLDGYYTKIYSNQTVARLVGPDSAYAKFMKEYGNIKRLSGDASQLVDLCTKYGNSLHVDKVKKKIENAKNDLYQKYPLLKYLNSAPELEVVDYIKMVDNQEKI